MSTHAESSFISLRVDVKMQYEMVQVGLHVFLSMSKMSKNTKIVDFILTQPDSPHRA
jgi:hypothetical protein